MNARTLTTTTLAAAVFAGVLPATAAAVDQQLLSLVMPDAKVLAGANVEQARNSLFGQYVLTTLQPNDQDLQDFAALTGFDPRRDVREVLVASNGVPGSKTGLALARGTFDPAKIAAAATAHGGSTDTYKGVTLVLDPKAEHAFAFLDVTLVVAGDVASVKAAIDRQSAPVPLPTPIAVKVGTLSANEDAWVLCAVPPSSLKPPSAAPQMPGITGQAVFNSVQQAAGGVKLGADVTVTAETTMTTAQDATTLGDLVKFLANFAAMQAGQKDPQIATLAQSLQTSINNNVLTVTFSMPESQLQQMVTPKARTGKKLAPHGTERRM